MSFIAFEAADIVCDHFLDLLTELGIQPPTGSSFEDELLSLTQLIEVCKNPNLVQGANQVVVLRSATGVHDFAAKVLTVKPLPEFKTFEPHLRLIAESKIAPASLSQNMESAYNDDTARKMAELYMGCLAAHIGTKVELDHPTHAKGDNPDVIFTVEGSGVTAPTERWALAIKTVSSKKGQTIFDRIKEGAAQIDAPKCPADRGMVVINAKNALNHDTLWNTIFPDLQSAMDALRGQLDALAESANTNRQQAEWDGIFMQKVARPVLFLGQSLVRVSTPASPETPTPLKLLGVYDANGIPDPVAWDIADTLNFFMAKILLGQPGRPGHPPR
jgi:hypothetical protein